MRRLPNAVVTSVITLVIRWAVLCLTVMCVAVLPARAQKLPPKLEPIPEPPPQTIGIDRDGALERGVRLSPRSAETIDEFVLDGRRIIDVSNANGSEYYLIEDLGDGTFAGQNSQDSRVRVPRWVILRF